MFSNCWVMNGPEFYSNLFWGEVLYGFCCKFYEVTCWTFIASACISKFPLLELNLPEFFGEIFPESFLPSKPYMKKEGFCPKENFLSFYWFDYPFPILEEKWILSKSSMDKLLSAADFCCPDFCCPDFWISSEEFFLWFWDLLELGFE